MKVGLISDTHGYFDPAVELVFEGVERILHAGDIGGQPIIHRLERIAPVTAVLGNNDWESHWRPTEMVELGGWRILIHHIATPGRPTAELASAMAHHKPGIVVYGHTHQAASRVLDSIHWINPGYAGKPRFNTPRSVAILELAPGLPPVVRNVSLAVSPTGGL